MQLEVGQYDATDPDDGTFPKDLPDGRIMLVRDVHLALEGRPFKVYGSGGGLPVECQGMDPAAVGEYLIIFNRFRIFGLPHGRGWAHELPWLVDMLQFLQGTYDTINAWRMQQGEQSSGDAPQIWEDG